MNAVAVLAAAFMVVAAIGTQAATTVQVTNLVDGETLRYPLVVLSGNYDGQTLQISAVSTNVAVSFTTYGTQFRCLVDLQPGTNTLTLDDANGPVEFRLVYLPATKTNWNHKIWYAVPADEAVSPRDTNWYVHFGLQARVMQSWMAEDQLRGENGRITFYPEMDAANNVDVGFLVLDQTRIEAEAFGSGIMYNLVRAKIPPAYRDGTHKNVVFTTVAHAALGSGDLAYVGAYTGIHPNHASNVMSALLSTQYSGPDYLTFATYCGVTLHEMIHCLHSIWHDFSPYHIMGGSYDISQYFTLTHTIWGEYFTPSDNLRFSLPHYETSAATMGNVRDLARWHRSVMSADPREYLDSAVEITVGPEYIAAESMSPLAVFQYYVPSASMNRHTNLYALGSNIFRKPIEETYLELGDAPFNVMVVDTEGNMKYVTVPATDIPVKPVADSYEVVGGTSLAITAPGVLANDVNPAGGVLAAALATNAQHGTVVLGADGGFTYTPENGYVGNDSFWYIAVDSLSSNRVAKVNLNISAPEPAGLPIVPWPKSMAALEGAFVLGAATRVIPATPDLRPLATVLTNELRLAFDLTLDVDSNAPAAGNILLQFTPTLTNEAHRVSVTQSGVVVEAGDYAALAAGTVSLLQVIARDGTQATIPCFTVEDEPLVGYRGLLIDCARQFHSMATLKQIIQLCRLYKIRYLQLHLTDDQAFMFPSTAFPQLTTQNFTGPAYTLAQLRELETYSQERGVTIIPELEIPGHAAAMNRTMPDLFKIKDTLPYEHHATINWAKAEVREAIDTLIGEICSVFQATPYFHIGGDEADFVYAHQNLHFIQRFADLGYAQPYDVADTRQLFRRLLRETSELISTKYGKQMLCWEGFHRDFNPQPLEPVPSTIPVMAFENTYYPAHQLVADGYPVINTAWNPLYVVNGMQASPENIYGWNLYRFGRFQPNWDQVSWVTVPTNSPQVIGAQMCSWEQPQNIELSTLRLRLAAMSERIWNPGGGRTFASFANRVAYSDALLTRLVGSGPAEWVDVGGDYVQPNIEIGIGYGANLTNHTRFWYATADCGISARLNGFSLTFDSGNGNPLNYTGVVSGAGSVIFHSSQATPIRLGGTLANNYTGTTLLNFGWVSLEKPPGQHALCGAITIGGSDVAWLRWTDPDQIQDTAALSVAANGSYLDLNGFSETLTTLTLPPGAVVKTALSTNNFLRVNTLVMGGITYTTGAFGAETPGGYVRGSGYILVGGTPPPVVTNPPALPASPAPADGVIQVTPFPLVLSWADSLRATSYDLYLWPAADSKPNTPTATLTEAQFTLPDAVASPVAYRWQVVANNSAGSTAGPVWTFTTKNRGDVSGEIDNPNYTIGFGNVANLIGHTTFGYITVDCAIPVINNGYTLTLDSGGGNPYRYAGRISGSGGLRLLSGFHENDGYWNSPIRIGGWEGNTYTGPTLVLRGAVSLEKTTGNALGGTITVGRSSDTARLIWMGHHQIDDSSDIIVRSGNINTNTYPGRGTFLNLNGRMEIIKSLTLETGTYVETGSGGVLTVDSLTVSGQTYPLGTYSSTNAAFVRGSGSIVVAIPVAPMTPTGLIAEAWDQFVYLSWNKVDNATEYKVRRSLVSNEVGTVIGIASNTTTTGFADFAVTNGVLYWYVVSAGNNVGVSSNSAPVSARPLPFWAPRPIIDLTGFTFNPQTGASVRVHAMGGIQYRLRYSDDPSRPMTAWLWLTPPADGWITAPSNGLFILRDASATNNSRRFYRPEVPNSGFIEW